MATNEFDPDDIDPNAGAPDGFNDPEGDPEDGALVASGSFGDSLRQTFRSAPWWVISTVVHVLILALLTLVVFTLEQLKNDEVVITTDLAEEKPEKKEKLEREVFKSTKEVEFENIVDNPVFSHDKVVVTDHVETENEMDMQTAMGHEDAISDVPMGGVGVVGTIGVGGGRGGAFGHRNGGGRTKSVGRFGGSKKTESAVDAALRWLALHQEPDGRWDCRKYEGNDDADTAMTGLALLAFLGAGHTEKTGKFKMTVRKGVDWLIKNQKGDGRWVRNMYQNGIAGLAMAEAYGMARAPKTGKAAQKAIGFITDIAQHEYMAWNYGPSRDSGARNDTSVSGWQVMALKSAKVAGLQVPGESFQGAINWLDLGQDMAGAGDADYNYKGGKMSYAGTKADPKPGQGGIAMTAAAGLMRQFLGWRREDPQVMGPANLLMDRLPGAGSINYYYWYYGTLVMFQMGGDHWNAWNAAMKPTLLNSQRKGGDEDGSWDPLGGGGVKSKGGRVMSTALAALCLEVYYRYLPIYKK